MKKSESKKSAKEKKPKGELADKPAREDFLIVGIGASAGGVSALKTFFENVSADSGAAYVVILHLSPDHDSQLAKVLQSVALIPVAQVTEQVRVEPNHVYVVPPNQHLEMNHGHIVVSANVSVEERRAPVDIFFRTLAESHAERAVAVILSGTGANGSMGIKRVKENGGAAFVQNPREAEFSEMPRNSIATDLIDLILNVSEIPAQIVAYRNNPGKIEIPAEPEKPPKKEKPPLQPQEQALVNIFTQLRVRTGHDFANYKRATMLRRIERRINVRQLPDIAAYAAYLRENPDETHALLKDLLISVTNFFRDKETFTYLEGEILPKLFDGKTSDEQVRVWVAGCATGEEAYSLAMFLAEQAAKAEGAPQIQIFATDIDEAAVAKAREGFYTLNDAADVSPERLKRFFTKETDGYRIRRELRELILFAHHNVIKDPPFSRLDLVTCRNMLIYLNSAAQERVMETFHFSLNAGGYLFLGNSETIDGAGNLYAIVSREHHIYQSRRAVPRVGYPVPDASAQTIRLAERIESEHAPENGQQTETRPPKRISFGELHQQFLEEYTPSIVVNEEHDIVHMSESSLRFLQMTGGEPTQNLLKLIRPELRLELRTALYQAAQRQKNVEVPNVKIKIDGREESVNISVRPRMKQGDAGRGFILVLFEAMKQTAGESETVYSSDEPVARQLEEELIRSKEQLRISSEQYEVQAEELKASNEELQAMNEELRSSAEELETGKEELQSLNEELGTVNQELKIKIEEISQTSSYLNNLINSTDIGTIFLDRLFRVELFTPAAAEIFNLIPADIGRPLADIAHRLEKTDLLADVKLVLKTLQAVEREVRSVEGRDFMVRVLPYRTKDDKIGGVVLTFYDVTARKQAEEAVRQSEERLQRAINIETVGVVFFNNDIEITDCNDAFLRMSGFTREEIRAGRFSWKVFTPEEFVEPLQRAIEELNTQGFTTPYEKEYIRKDGSRFWALFSCRRISENESVEFVSDISEKKRAEEAVRRSEEKYRTLFDSIDEGVSTIELIFDENGRAVDYYVLEQNPAFVAQTGLPREAVGKRISEVLPDLEAFWFEIFERVAKTGEPHRFEHAVAGLADNWFEVYVSRVGGTGSRTIVLVYNNITARKRTEANLAFLAEVSQDLVSLTNIDETMNLVGAKIASYLDLSACAFAELDETAAVAFINHGWHRSDVPSLLGTYRMEEFMRSEVVESCRAGETVIVRDVFDDPRFDGEQYAALNVGSFVSIPLVRGGEWRFLLVVYRTKPSDWTDDEIELLRELTGRIWIRLERARAEAALAASEAKYRTLFASIDEGFAIYELKRDESGVMVDAIYRETNESYERLTGLKNVVGRWVSELVPNLEPSWFAVNQRVADTGIAERAEDYIADLDRWFSVHWSRVGGAGSDLIVAVFDDITERKLQERQQEFLLKFSDALRAEQGADAAANRALEMLVEYLRLDRSYITTYDLENDRARLDYQIGNDTVPPLPDRFVLSDYPEAFENTKEGTLVINDELERQGLSEEEKRNAGKLGMRAMVAATLRKDEKKPLWSMVAISSRPRRWTKGEIALIEEVAERTWAAIERARAEEALRESEERLRLLIESASDYAIFTLSPDGRINSWNAGAEKIFGWTESEVLGESADIIFTPEDRQSGAPEMEMKAALRAGSTPDERFHLRRDGSRFYVSGVLASLTDEKGNARGFVKIARDMTERIAAEKIAHDKEMLQKLVSAQEDERKRIARDLHDELGQQLTALRLKLDAARKLCDGDELCGKVDEIELIAKSIDNGVDFLAWELRPAALDDLGLVAALENYVKQWSHHSGVKAELLASKLKSARFAPEAETNLYRIVQEALNNTHKHAHARNVEVMLERRDGLIAMLIEDNGKGFNPKDKKSRLKGMGLIGMRERAHLIGGTLEIESAPGKGTTVFVRVPVASAKRKKSDGK